MAGQASMIVLPESRSADMAIYLHGEVGDLWSCARVQASACEPLFVGPGWLCKVWLSRHGLINRSQGGAAIQFPPLPNRFGDPIVIGAAVTGPEVSLCLLANFRVVMAHSMGSLWGFLGPPALPPSAILLVAPAETGPLCDLIGGKLVIL